MFVCKYLHLILATKLWNSRFSTMAWVVMKALQDASRVSSNSMACKVSGMTSLEIRTSTRSACNKLLYQRDLINQVKVLMAFLEKKSRLLWRWWVSLPFALVYLQWFVFEHWDLWPSWCWAFQCMLRWFHQLLGRLSFAPSHKFSEPKLFKMEFHHYFPYLIITTS